MGLERIKDIRKLKGMTIEELSEKSGVPVSTIKKISAGITKNPNLETVRAIARALNCTLDDFDDPIEIDKLKKSPEPTATDSKEMQEEEVYQLLKKTFLELNIDVGSLTERQKVVLEVLADMIAQNF